MAAVAAGGLVVTGLKEERLSLPAHTDPAEALGGGADLVLLSVKAGDTAAAVRELARHWKDGGTILSLQNGLGNLEAIAREGRDDWTILGGATSMGSYLDAPGEVVYAGAGRTSLGTWREGAVDAAGGGGIGGGPNGGAGSGAGGESGRAPDLQEVADLLAASGMKVTTTPDPAGEVWRKAVVNAAINPLMAITGHRNGYLLEEPAMMEVARTVCAEGAMIGKAAGLDIGEDELVDRMEDTVTLTAGNKCSMLQDVEKGRRTEVDMINGELVRRAMEHGIPAPVNRTLWALVRGLEPSSFSRA